MGSHGPQYKPAPIAKIDSPAGVKDFLETQIVSFSANSSSDPDGDFLTFSWKEKGGILASTPEFTSMFSPGSHNITLEVSDGFGASIHRM